MNPSIAPADLSFFATVASHPSLSSAARELGLSTAAVSKRLSGMEARLGAALFNRTTRRMSLTEEGAAFHIQVKRILADLEGLAQTFNKFGSAPSGLLRVNATLGFGRSHIAPLISTFAHEHKNIEVRLQLSVNPPPLSDDAFDVCIRFGEPPDSRVIAKRLAANRRLLVASPAYLKRAGVPQLPQDLIKHSCIGIRQGEEAYGVWRLTNPKTPHTKAEVIKTRGSLSTNDGEIAVNWALDGHGILMRAQWDIERYLKSGRLVQVLPDWQTPPADIYAVYPERHASTARVKVFVDWLAEHLRPAVTKTAVRSS
jgi:LysR family transcriptional regulator, transcriptional activator for dmlA